MDIDSFNIELKCLFCDSTLTGKTDAKFESGDLIPCNACGEKNDYDSVLQIAKETGVSEVKRKIQDALKKMFQ